LAGAIGPVRFGMAEPGMETLLLVLDLVGTFVFAPSGAKAGVNNRLDLFGVLVLSFTAGNAGGIARDLVIGAVPPPAISDWHYLAVSLLAGIVTFWRPSGRDRHRVAASVDPGGDRWRGSLLRDPVDGYSPRLASPDQRRTRATDHASACAEGSEG